MIEERKLTIYNTSIEFDEVLFDNLKVVDLTNPSLYIKKGDPIKEAKDKTTLIFYDDTASLNIINNELGFSKENQAPNQKRLDMVKELIEDKNNTFAVDLDFRKNIITKATLLSGDVQKKGCNIRIISNKDMHQDRFRRSYQSFNNWKNLEQRKQKDGSQSFGTMTVKNFLSYYHNLNKRGEEDNCTYKDIQEAKNKTLIKDKFANAFGMYSYDKDDYDTYINLYGMLGIIYKKTLQTVIADPSELENCIQLDYLLGCTLNKLSDEYITFVNSCISSNNQKLIHIKEFMVHADNKGLSDEQFLQVQKLLDNSDNHKLATVILNKVNPAISLLELLALSTYINDTITRVKNIEFTRLLIDGYDVYLTSNYNLNHRVNKIEEIYGKITKEQLEKIAMTYKSHRNETSDYYNLTYTLK